MRLPESSTIMSSVKLRPSEPNAKLKLIEKKIADTKDLVNSVAQRVQKTCEGINNEGEPQDGSDDTRSARIEDEILKGHKENLEHISRAARSLRDTSYMCHARYAGRGRERYPIGPRRNRKLLMALRAIQPPTTGLDATNDAASSAMPGAGGRHSRLAVRVILRPRSGPTNRAASDYSGDGSRWASSWRKVILRPRRVRPTHHGRPPAPPQVDPDSQP